MKTPRYIGSTIAAAVFLLSAGSALAQTAGLTADLTVAPSVPAGSQNVVLSTLTLTATAQGQAVSVSSFPISESFNVVSNSDFSNCSVQNAAALGLPLSSSMTLGSTGSTFNLFSPVIVSGGTVQRLSVVCDVSAFAPPGGTVNFSITPSSIAAAAGGVNITPTASTSTSGTVTVTAFIGTGSGTGTGTGTGSVFPDVPNTGIGGDVLATLLILALSLLAAFIGATVTRKMKGQSTPTSA